MLAMHTTPVCLFCYTTGMSCNNEDWQSANHDVGRDPLQSKIPSCRAPLYRFTQQEEQGRGICIGNLNLIYICWAKINRKIDKIARRIFSEVYKSQNCAFPAGKTDLKEVLEARSRRARFIISILYKNFCPISRCITIGQK